MRIPSQFNEDSLYRRHRRPDESSQSYRRLIRLVIGLALVLVVMRQASKPEMYRVFFGSAPATGASAGGPVVLGQTKLVDLPDVDAVVPPSISAVDRRIANEVTSVLAPSDQRMWLAMLAKWQRGNPVTQLPSTLELMRERLESIDAIADQKRSLWRATFDSLERSVSASADQAGGPAADERFAVALLAALDLAATSRVMDGSVWRADDFDAFYRYLDQAAELPSQGVPATGVLPLLQQPDVFRGQLVRVQGTVARVEQMTAEENLFGVDDYWQLWLRPADGADRPLVLIVPELDRRLETIADPSSPPPVFAVGRYLKRLAYQSGIGADLAPVIIGRILPTESTTPRVVAQADAVDSSSSRLLMTVLAAIFVGVGVAVVTMWRTSVAARDSRRLRTAHRDGPDGFLQQLESNKTPNANDSLLKESPGHHDSGHHD